MIKVFLLSFLIIFSSYASSKPISTTIDCENKACQLRLEIAEGWKIYSHSEGLETSLEVKLSEQTVKNFQVHWDQEKVFEESFFGIMGIYHLNNSIIPITFEPQDEYFSLPLEIHYAACKDTCLFLTEKIHYEKGNNNLVWILISAILGGFCLNFMPCLLPILGLKILALQKRKQNLITFYLGIISSFLVLGLVNIIFKLLGKSLGWGFHFQEPLFIAFFTIVLGWSALHLIGVLKIPAKFHLKDRGSEFLKGIFLVLVASSCTGPFLGPVLAFAMTQSPITILLTYLSIGFGFSLPYLLLIIKPKLLKLPKKGPWLNKMKIILSIPLGLCSLWFLSLLITNQIILFALTLVIIFLPLIVKKPQLSLIPLGVLLITLSLRTSRIKLEKIDLQDLDQSIKEGRQVVVKITSDWCITCKVNEQLVFERIEVKKKLEKAGVLVITGDYTRGSEDLTNYIKSHKRSGVPLNIVYGPKAPEGIVLPVLFSEEELFTALEKSKRGTE